ncbi:MAG: fused MFS/spermidine synthase [Acidobacteriota bacterium]|nr:fused MFS/spermidine synthase [Acidobacteriota bacterium]MDH3524022.1 fused MFS/spermidine synthase [Acidobacteriota bacterium]
MPPPPEPPPRSALLREVGPGAEIAILAGCFLLSGAASLMDQVVWLRYLSLVFGNTTLAAATLLSVFMGGLGLGALLFGRWSDRLRRPLAIYAAAELAIGAIALASPWTISVIDAAYVAVYRGWGNQPLAFALGRTLLAALVLLPPTVLMGGTLPLMLRAVTPAARQVGRTSALFYGINTAGAVAGTAFAGFVSIRAVGLYATLQLAAGANLIAALLAWRLARPLAPAAPPRTPGLSPARHRLRALFFAMGATSLAFEVLWTRILVFHLGSGVYAYSLMLVLVLLGIGLGSLAATPWADRVASPLVALGLVELGIGLWIPLQVLLFHRLDAMLLAVGAWVGPTTFAGINGIQLATLLPLLGPPTLLMGVSFPLAVRAFNRELGRLGGDVGQVYGANTLGAVAGSLAAGFFLIPWLGTQNGLLATGALNALIGAYLMSRRDGRRRWPWAAPILVLGLAALLPADRVILAAGPFRDDAPGAVVYFHEDAQASVTVRRREKDGQPYYALELNGVAVAGTSPELYAAQKMQGHLPLLLGGGTDSVVHIGFGTGGTAWAVSRHAPADVLIVEISSEVLRASDTYFPALNHGVLDLPEVRVEVNDGRNFLLATAERFDAVLSDSIHPSYAGNGSLYSYEYFRLIRERLAPGGVASMWLPMYYLTPRNYAMILRAFRDVFPHVAVWYEPSTLNAFTIVTGKLASDGWDGEVLERAFARPEIASELADLGIGRPADLVPLLLATSAELDPWLAEVPPHVDDLPAVEYESGTLLDRNAPWLEIFGRLLALRPTEPPAAYVSSLPAAERDRARELYRAHAATLERQRRFLASELRALAERRD